MKKVPRLKIRSKKPEDRIIEKTPIKEKTPAVTQKVPTDSRAQFELPPSRKKEEETIAKEDINYPTSHGKIDEGKKHSSSTNQQPPKQLQKKKKIQMLPSRKGITSKKPKKIVNKTPQKLIRHKSPSKRSPLPPRTIGIKQKDERKVKKDGK